MFRILLSEWMSVHGRTNTGNNIIITTIIVYSNVSSPLIHGRTTMMMMSVLLARGRSFVKPPRWQSSCGRLWRHLIFTRTTCCCCTAAAVCDGTSHEWVSIHEEESNYIQRYNNTTLLVLIFTIICCCCTACCLRWKFSRVSVHEEGTTHEWVSIHEEERNYIQQYNTTLESLWALFVK